MICQKIRPFIPVFVTNLFRFCVPENPSLFQNHRYEVFELIIYRLFPNPKGDFVQITFEARTFQLFLKLRFVSQTNGNLLCLRYLPTKI
jgi:hypothetical protein